MLLEVLLELLVTLEELLALPEVLTWLFSALDELAGRFSELIISLDELPGSTDENFTTLDAEITGGAETFGFSLVLLQPVSNIKTDKAAAIFFNVLLIINRPFARGKRLHNYYITIL